MAKSQAVKFEVGNYVLFSGHRVGQVSRIAKNGAIYVNVLGETTVVDQTCEELRVKKADLRHVSDMMAATGDYATEWDYVANMIRANISRKVTARVSLADDGAYELAPDYIPSPNCLEYCEWKGSKADQSALHNFGIDLVKLANLYTGKSKTESAEIPQDTPPVMEEPDAPAEPVQSTLALESTEPPAASSPESAVALDNAKYALRELTFSVTRHSILTAFIDVALNKNIPGYHHQVASNLKSLMAAAFDPVHDPMGYARINMWTMAALELVVKHKDRVAKMLGQPIEAAPIKIDRVTKLGMWLDNMMNNKGPKVNDMTSAWDSCYMYDSWTKKVGACVFVVVEVAQAMGSNKVEVLPIPASINKEFSEHLTAQSAIAVRKQYIDYWRQLEPGLSSYCGIVPVYKTRLALQAAIEDALRATIGRLK